MVLKGKRTLQGQVSVPGDKSISHRAVILGGIARGESRIKGLSDARDVMTTVEAFRLMGVPVHFKKGVTVVEGAGITGFEKLGQGRKVEIDCGNSGTTARLLMGLLSGSRTRARLTGDLSLQKRPMGRVAQPLTEIGALIKTAEGHLPAELECGKLIPFDFIVPVPSAQVKSALILAALFMKGMSVVTEPVATRDHTERMLLFMDAGIKTKNTHLGKAIFITGRKELTSLEFTVPGDISSAVFFIAAALICPFSDLTITNVLLNPTRAPILDVFRKMGGRIDIEVVEEFPEPRGNLRVRSSKLRGITVSKTQIPLIIDEIPALAACALFAKGWTVVKGAGELRIKEGDRIKGIVHMVNAFDGRIEEREDGFIISGGGRLHEADVRSFGDHRMAMAASVVALGVKGKSVIRDAHCVDVSFPGFFEELARCCSQYYSK